jgi:hypothetical protein
MNTLTGLFIITAGAFCQSGFYVPINKVKRWSWESFRFGILNPFRSFSANYSNLSSFIN